MRYAQIRTLDISNGEGIGIALFTQGCPFRCKNCFNPDTWDFNKGIELTDNEVKYILYLLENNKRTRFSILGGEPLIEDNFNELYSLVRLIKYRFPNIKIWLYTGNTIEQINPLFYPLLEKIDILIDGPYIDELKDFNLKFRGSSNQRVIDIQETIKQNKIILYIE